MRIEPSPPGTNRTSNTERATPAVEPGRPTPPGALEPAPERSPSPPTSGEVRARVLEIMRTEYPPAPPAAVADGGAPVPLPAFRDPIPARMLNEFVYCPRLFYYEFVEGVFVENADTLRGKALHRRVDAGSGALPPAASGGSRDERPAPNAQRSSRKGQGEAGPAPVTAGADADDASAGDPQPPADEIIHSRSVQMGSARLGITAKMDLVEVRPGGEDLFSALEVCPVDYKAGAPREGDEGNELWDADRMQLGVQALILRDNGYTCHEAVVYYRATKQRVRLPVTPALEAWVIDNIGQARAAAAGRMPAPLVNSPKCPRCSLVTVCLPDETRFLQATAEAAAEEPGAGARMPCPTPRRLIAARDDTRALYLNTPGLRVGRKDELLQIKEEKAVIDEVRLKDVSHVALFGNIQITTQAVQALCEAEIPVTYFSMGGWFYGLTRGHELKNVFLRLEQFRQARDPAACLRLARQFVHGKIRNHRTMLMRNHVEPPPAALLRLKQMADAALHAASMGELLGFEGNGAAAYFEQFGGMLKADDNLDPPVASAPAKSAPPVFHFNFTHRNRRPPTDPVNAMLSLAYSLLAKDCVLALLAVGFDPYVGFFHQPRFGRPALALDLMEEFRGLVADSTVLSCINNRAIVESDFVRAGPAVNLTPPGRRRFFEMYEQRMNSVLTHPVFDYKVSYRRALELQARMMAKVLTGEIPEYLPLMTR